MSNKCIYLLELTKSITYLDKHIRAYDQTVGALSLPWLMGQDLLPPWQRTMEMNGVTSWPMVSRTSVGTLIGKGANKDKNYFKASCILNKQSDS